MIKQIKDHPNYAVSDSGQVYKINEDGLVRLKEDISINYPRVKLNGRKYYVADLVAEYFLKSRPENYKIFYVDGNCQNCDVTNLKYLSQSDIKRYSQYTPEYRMQILGEWNERP